MRTFVDFLYQLIQQIFCASRLIPKPRQCANHYISLCAAENSQIQRSGLLSVAYVARLWQLGVFVAPSVYRIMEPNPDVIVPR